jgi:endonuclease-3
LLKIKGVGNKIALLFLSIAFGQVQGIPVDTHCHRVPNRLKWIETASPKETQAVLERIIPRTEWSEFNKTIVGFGQQTCKAKQPLCYQCPIYNECLADDKIQY